MTADLDTLLTALYVELTDRIIPFRGPGRRGLVELVMPECRYDPIGTLSRSPVRHGGSASAG